MRTFSILGVCCVVAICANAAPQAQPAELSILASADGEAWRALFEKLGGQGAISSHFTERRWFAMRKQPIELQGEMRMAPDRGLSLHYAEKGGRTMIVDAQGILLRDDRGRTRNVPKNSPAAGAGALLLPVLQFNIPELEKSFSIQGARDGETWRLELVPRGDDVAQALRGIRIAGAGERVDRIEIDRGEKQRIEIVIGETRTGVQFSAEEEKKFFRAKP